MTESLGYIPETNATVNQLYFNKMFLEECIVLLLQVFCMFEITGKLNNFSKQPCQYHARKVEKTSNFIVEVRPYPDPIHPQW